MFYDRQSQEAMPVNSQFSTNFMVLGEREHDLLKFTHLSLRVYAFILDRMNTKFKLVMVSIWDIHTYSKNTFPFFDFFPFICTVSYLIPTNSIVKLVGPREIGFDYATKFIKNPANTLINSHIL